MEAGHIRAAEYPLGFLWDEFNLVMERRNSLILTETTMMQHVVALVFGGKNGAEALNKAMAKLNVEAVSRKMPPNT